MTVCIPTQDGIPYIQWINSLFGECVYGPQDAISLLLGYFSIFFWFNAQIPQLIENYRAGSADGLSLHFLAIWLAGDSANLIGAILTHQLPFQLYLGVYFVSIDICLLCQWTYYNKIKSKHDYLIIPDMDIKKTPSNLFQHPAADCAPLNISHPQVQNELTPFSSSASPSKWYTLDAKDHSNTNYSKLMAMLLFTTTQYLPASSLSTMTTMSAASSESGFEFTQENALWIGRIFAWICTTLYLLSRIPQLLKNRRRQSVEGLAITLFLFAVLGNLTYSLSILTHPGQTAESLLEALPYLIGSAGTLVFDFSIFCQFLWYRKSNKDVEFV